jgi:hypothetical protein
MVDGMSEKPPIPLVDLVRHYRGFKSKRLADGRRNRGPYRSQIQRVELARQYIDDPQPLVELFARSVSAFALYANPNEKFVGDGRTDPPPVRDTKKIDTGPAAAAYLRFLEKTINIEGLGGYVYVDREVRPARTTSGPDAGMANRFDDEARTRSTSAMSADLLLRSLPNGRPTVGEVKLSTADGDDADPFYALIQALALASQLVSASQRARLCRYYKGFAEKGPLDVLVFLFLMGEYKGTRTYRKELVELAGELCRRLDHGRLHAQVERVALVQVTRRLDRLRFTVDGT